MNILFIPGNSQSTNTYSEQIKSPLLQEHQMSVFNLEETVNSLTEPTPETFFFAVKEKLIELHKEQQFDCIVGHSWGGHLLIESIAEMEGVKGIITFGAPFMSIPPRMEESFLPNPALPMFYSKELSSEQLTQLADACLFNKKWVEYIANGMGNSSGLIRELTPGAIGTGSYTDEVEALPKLNIPLAIVHGEKDEFINVNYYSSLTIPTLWQNEVQIVSQSGHFPQLENAEEFNRLLNDFLKDIQ